MNHLGIVAGIIDDIGIVEKINEIYLIDSREKINTGEVVKAIILNGIVPLRGSQKSKVKSQNANF